MATNRMVSATFHVIGLSIFATTLAWLPNIKNPLHKGFGGSFQFLTIIALTISTITFGISLLADFYPSKRLSSVKNMLSVCAAPLEVVVSILYWNHRASATEFVLPPEYILPIVPDLGFHAIPAVLLILDFLLLSPPWSIKAFDAFIVDFIFFSLYMSWVEYCFWFNGWYPYPGLAVLPAWKKPLATVAAALLMTGSTMVLKLVHKKIHGSKGSGPVVVKVD